MSDYAVPSLETRNAEMLKTGEYSDLTIKCKDKAFKVHRYIVCMLSGRIKSLDAANEKAGRSRNISLDLEPATMERVLGYMYSGDYEYGSESGSTTRVPVAGAATAPILISDAPSEGPQTATSSAHTRIVDNAVPQNVSGGDNDLEPPSVTGTGALQAHAQMYVAAQQLRIHGLHRIARSKYAAVLIKEVETRSFVESLRFLLENSKLFKGEFLLRGEIISFIVTRYRHFIHKDEYAALATAHPDFAIRISRAMVGLIAFKKVIPPSKECPTCKTDINVRTSTPRYKLLGNYYCEGCNSQFN
ncbi:hypothetical protein BKA64DRAFT_769753 [Cadophora sp. MPI-SDFR-AT-0126]|nr:hypothetical protein BKA64DRAFT_769753 [Leotiomycetes sp. MPI-SDFR-AT-0126]